MNKSRYFVGLALVASALRHGRVRCGCGRFSQHRPTRFLWPHRHWSCAWPVVIYPQPVIIEQRTVNVVRQPIYLRVPPGHDKNWRKHCSRYQACGQPVYFVQDDWYRDVYAAALLRRRQDAARMAGIVVTTRATAATISKKVTATIKTSERRHRALSLADHSVPFCLNLSVAATRARVMPGSNAAWPASSTI